MVALTRRQVQELDRRAVEELGIPGVVLMENAGRHAAEIIADVVEQELQLTPSDARVVVLCGGGNNGGDGYVIARHLHNFGIEVVAAAVKAPETLQGDAAVNCRVAQNMGLVIPMHEPGQLAEQQDIVTGAHVVVDALLGTGFTGSVRDDIADAIVLCNEAHNRGASVVAVDVPSGLDCDSGEAQGLAVSADVTVTFAAPKVGFKNENAQAHLGQIHVADIGTPPQLIQDVIAEAG